MPWLAGGSMLILAVLIYLLYLESQTNTSSGTEHSLKVYCAAALKPVMETIAEQFENETGRHIEFEFGDSGNMLGSISIRTDGDLFLPADDSFIRLAEERGLLAQTIPLSRMKAVILTRPGNPLRIAKFDDLMSKRLKFGLANPDTAAIGRVVRDHLTRLARWDIFASHIEAQFSTVTDSANAVQLGSIHAAIVWDAVAVNYPDLATVRVPELDGAVGRVELAVLAAAPDMAGARRLARYIAASDRGLAQFRKSGFSDVGPGSPWASHGGEP